MMTYYYSLFAAFAANVTHISHDGREYQLEMTLPYWGNTTLDLTVSVLPMNSNGNDNCFCPQFDIGYKEHIILSRSQIQRGVLGLQKTDYVALYDGHTSLFLHSVCGPKLEDHPQIN